MALVLLLMLQGRTSGGHGLLEAVPRIYQVTPDIPDRRRATKQKEVRPSPADSLNESQLAARSGTSPPRRTSPTSPMRTASPRSGSGRLVLSDRAPHCRTSSVAVVTASSSRVRPDLARGFASAQSGMRLAAVGLVCW